MQLLPLVDSATISISYDDTNEWLYADWKGAHDQDTAQANCLQVLECLRAQACRKVLTDNTNVESTTAQLTSWGMAWLDEMREAGLQHMAWVLPRSFAARHTTEAAVKAVSQPVVATFDDVASAYVWLQKAHAVPPAPEVLREAENAV
jgi:hypothetical protein